MYRTSSAKTMDDTKIREVETRIPARVTQVKKILSKKHNLVLPEQYDDFIIRCLRMKDGKAEKAARIILTYREAVKTAEEWGWVFKPSLYAQYYQKNPVALLRQKDSNGCSVFLNRPSVWNPSEMSYDEYIAASWLLSEHCVVNYPELQSKGAVVICDCTNYSWQHAWAVNQWRNMTFIKWSQSGIGGRMLAIHVINHPKSVGYLYRLIWPLLRDKSRKRIIFHDNLESLHRYVSPKILPEELGGLQAPEDCFDESLYGELLNKDKYFEQIASDGLPTK